MRQRRDTHCCSNFLKTTLEQETLWGWEVLWPGSSWTGTNWDWRHLSSSCLDQRCISYFSLPWTRLSWKAVIRKNLNKNNPPPPPPPKKILFMIHWWHFSQWQPSFSEFAMRRLVNTNNLSCISYHKATSQAVLCLYFLACRMKSFNSRGVSLSEAEKQTEPFNFSFVSYKSNKTSFLWLTSDQVCCLKPGCKLLSPRSALLLNLVSAVVFTLSCVSEMLL